MILRQSLARALTLLWEQPLGARKHECVTPMDLVARHSESVADEDAA